MTVQKSVVLLSNTRDLYDVIGTPYRADSWYGYTDGIHTVSMSCSNLYGNFHLQGTLSTDPEDETSWFDIDINFADNEIPYYEFYGESGIRAYTFIGNFTFIRASLIRSERDDLSPLNMNQNKNDVNHGFIDKALLAM